MRLRILLIPEGDWTWVHIVIYVATANICAWIPVIFTLRLRREKGYATLWDRVTGTRVVIKPKGTMRPLIEPATQEVIPTEGTEFLGPYRIIKEIVPDKWIVATDPVLRRRVWLIRRFSSEPSLARRNISRPGRLRWLQKVGKGDTTWDAFEATDGVSFSSLIEGNKLVPWSDLRHWLHDLASELWEATGDETLPAELSLDHVWITGQGRAVLLDVPWPDVKTPCRLIDVTDLAGQQRFLNAIASCVESTCLPLHTRPVLQNLTDGKFEKLSFLTGTLRGLLEKSVEVSKGIRFGSIFMMPLYIWIVFFVGCFQGEMIQRWKNSPGWFFSASIIGVLSAMALFQLIGLAFRSTFGHSIFRLAVIDAGGQLANRATLLRRWAVVWLSLFTPMTLVAVLIEKAGPTAAFIYLLLLFLLWFGAAVYAVIHPHRGLHDRLAGTWVVRR